MQRLNKMNSVQFVFFWWKFCKSTRWHPREDAARPRIIVCVPARYRTALVYVTAMFLPEVLGGTEEGSGGGGAAAVLCRAKSYFTMPWAVAACQKNPTQLVLLSLHLKKKHSFSTLQDSNISFSRLIQLSRVFRSHIFLIRLSLLVKSLPLLPKCIHAEKVLRVTWGLLSNYSTCFFPHLSKCYSMDESTQTCFRFNIWNISRCKHTVGQLKFGLSRESCATPPAFYCIHK